MALLFIFLAELASVGLCYYFQANVRAYLDDTIAPVMIKNYRENDDYQALMDDLQEYWECCGMGSNDYK